jgi:serine/threonine protein kinase
MHRRRQPHTLSMENQETRRFGRYEIVAELGRGAMGVVYKARDPQIDRQVAVKTFSIRGHDPEQEEEFRQRFVCEAQAAGRLHHPGIVAIFDVGQNPEDQSPYIVLEFVAGETLNKILVREKKLPLANALQLAEELAEALDYAHAQGVVHRDIKPANILVTEDGHAKIADFGIAKLNLSQMTLPGKVLGTPAYMAPEQLSGEGVDGRSDIFSLGVILYAMVTGHSPFHGNSATTVCYKVVNRDPVPASAFDLDLPRTLDAVIFRAMAKDPADRYQRGAELAHDLRGLRMQYKPGSTTMSMGVLARATTGSFHVSPSTTARAAAAGKANDFFGAALRRTPLRDIILGAALTVLVIGVAIPAREAFLSPKTTAIREAGIDQDGVQDTSVASRRNQQPPVPRISETEAARPASPSGSSAAQNSAPKKAKSQKLQTANRSAVKSQSKAVIVPTATLELAVQHQFKEATLSIWIDDQLALTRPLHGGTQKRLVVFNGIRGVGSESIQVPAGTHTLRLRAQTSDQSIDLSKTVSAEFVGGGVKNLQVTFDRHNTVMRLSWQ